MNTFSIIYIYIFRIYNQNLLLYIKHLKFDKNFIEIHLNILNYFNIFQYISLYLYIIN